jgi:putative phosphoesterase
MTRVGLLSDTHGWLDPAVLAFLDGCDEVWHCGDIGDLAVTDTLAARFRLRAVHGNVDDAITRRLFPAVLQFEVDGVNTVITHVGGTPGHPDRRVANLLLAARPRLFACGHTHIARVQRDGDLLHLNPGAAGRVGFHDKRTALRFSLHAGRILELELLELEKRPAPPPVK